MADLFHKRKRHQPARDDVEANASNGEGSSGTTAPAANNLSEYAALERFISTYREDGTATVEGDDNQKSRRRSPWWKFWQSSTEPTQEKNKTTTVPQPWLATDIHSGIRQTDVEERRKIFGWNELTTEKENMFAKFFTYFTGPILYGE